MQAEIRWAWQPSRMAFFRGVVKPLAALELCLQLADSGCIAISGGLEVASDRLAARWQR